MIEVFVFVVFGDKGFVDQVFGYDDVGQGVDDGDICIWLQLQMMVSLDVW